MRPLLLAAALLAAACDPSTIDPMKRQPKFRAYGQTRLFDDGRMMREPPPGAVPRERRLGDAALTQGKNPDGSFVTRIPVPLDLQSLQRGRKHFEVMCAACHGLAGDGDSPVARRMSLRPPPSLHAVPRPPGYVFAAVSQGFGFMPSYAWALNVQERWETIAYLQALTRSQTARLSDAPSDVQERLRQEAP